MSRFTPYGSKLGKKIENQQKEQRKLAIELDEKADTAFRKYYKNRELGIQPIPLQARSVEQEQKDISRQLQIAKMNLLQLTKENDASIILGILNKNQEELFRFNKYFAGFRKYVGHISILTPESFKVLWSSFNDEKLNELVARESAASERLREEEQKNIQNIVEINELTLEQKLIDEKQKLIDELERLRILRDEKEEDIENFYISEKDRKNMSLNDNRKYIYDLNLKYDGLDGLDKKYEEVLKQLEILLENLEEGYRKPIGPINAERELEYYTEPIGPNISSEKLKSLHDTFENNELPLISKNIVKLTKNMVDDYYNEILSKKPKKKKKPKKIDAKKKKIDELRRQNELSEQYRLNEIDRVTENQRNAIREYEIERNAAERERMLMEQEEMLMEEEKRLIEEEDFARRFPKRHRELKLTSQIENIKQRQQEALRQEAQRIEDEKEILGNFPQEYAERKKKKKALETINPALEMVLNATKHKKRIKKKAVETINPALEMVLNATNIRKKIKHKKEEPIRKYLEELTEHYVPQLNTLEEDEKIAKKFDINLRGNTNKLYKSLVDFKRSGDYDDKSIIDYLLTNGISNTKIDYLYELERLKSHSRSIALPPHDELGNREKLQIVLDGISPRGGKLNKTRKNKSKQIAKVLPKKSKIEQRIIILNGEIRAGNDNPMIIEELKYLLSHIKK
jgi:hypothetical protein